MLSEQQIENRITQLLVQRARASGELNGLELGELDGLFKKIKKAAKKIAKTVVKVAKVAAPAVVGIGAGIGAAKLTGSLLKKSKSKKAPPISVSDATQYAQNEIAANGAPALANDVDIASVIRDAMATAAMSNAGAASYSGGGGGGAMYTPPMYDQAPELPEVEVKAKPNWVVPAAIGGGVLLLSLLAGNRRSRA